MKIVMACLAFIASASAALAADAGPVVAPGPFAPPPAFPAARANPDPTITPGPFDPPPAYSRVRVYDWTGFYLGINGGAVLGTTNWYSTPDLAGGALKTSSGLIGGTAGYNLQAGDAVVVGAEADMDWTGAAGTIAPTSCAPCSFKSPWFATTRLRLGYAFNNILPYVTGGVAIAEFDANMRGAPAGTAVSNNLGWTVGGGIEVAITEALRAKAEYLYANLNGFSCYGPCGGGPISFNVSTNVVRAGLNYRFWTN